MSDWITTRIGRSGEGRALRFVVYCPRHKTPWTIARFSLVENFTARSRAWGTELAAPAALTRTAKGARHLLDGVPISERPTHLRHRPTPGVTVVGGQVVQPTGASAQGDDKHTTHVLECEHCGRRGGRVQRREENLWPVLDLLVDAGRTKVTLAELAKVAGEWDRRRVGM